jgi:hypothetical protein
MMDENGIAAGSYTPVDMMAGVGLSYRAADFVSLGATLNYAGSRLWGISGHDGMSDVFLLIYRHFSESEVSAFLYLLQILVQRSNLYPAYPAVFRCTAVPEQGTRSLSVNTLSPPVLKPDCSLAVRRHFWRYRS